MLRRIIVLCVTTAVCAVTPVAGATHGDQNAETNAQRCDRWQRINHPHGHTDGSDITVGSVRIHSHSGHHMLTTPGGYLEVVGGQAYKGPHPDTGETFGQGGFVQGELDVASGIPDVDFNIAFFGPDTDTLPTLTPAGVLAWAERGYGSVCISVANTKQNVVLPI